MVSSDRCETAVIAYSRFGMVSSSDDGISLGASSAHSDHLDVCRLAIARGIEIVEDCNKLVAAALVKAASGLVISAVRGFNVDPRAAGRGNLPLRLFQQQLADALALLVRFDSDPIDIEAADRDRVFAEADVADRVALLLGKYELVARGRALVEPSLHELDRHIHFANTEQAGRGDDLADNVAILLLDFCAELGGGRAFSFFGPAPRLLAPGSWR